MVHNVQHQGMRSFQHEHVGHPRLPEMLLANVAAPAPQTRPHVRIPTPHVLGRPHWLPTPNLHTGMLRHAYLPGHPADLEWRLTYIGNAESEEYDQVLDSVLVGPVVPGQYRFVFQVGHLHLPRAKLLCRVVSCTPKTRAVQQLEQLCSWHANVGCIACAAVFLRRQGMLCQNATDV